MADNMSLKQLPLTIIVAATPKNGIGVNNSLPWPMIKSEMAYFARVTKRVPTQAISESVQANSSKETSSGGNRQNVVIMGRKTWESIPTKFRPLKQRTNIVISSQSREQLGAVPDDVVVASDISFGLDALEKLIGAGKAHPVGRAFVIGGSAIYQKALQLPQTKHVLLTRIRKDYKCDTFFPANLADTMNSDGEWQRNGVAELRNFVQEDVSEGPVSDEADGQQIEFEFQLYERT